MPPLPEEESVAKRRSPKGIARFEPATGARHANKSNSSAALLDKGLKTGFSVSSSSWGTTLKLSFRIAKSCLLIINTETHDLVFKVCGAEVDSSLESVDRGVVFAAAPLDKRMSLAMFSAASAALPYTSDALHACLLGEPTTSFASEPIKPSLE